MMTVVFQTIYNILMNILWKIYICSVTVPLRPGYISGIALSDGIMVYCK